jgi:hypothetical protein
MPSASCRIDERKVGNKCTVAATLFGRLAVGLSCGAQPSEPNRKRKGLQAFNNNRLLQDKGMRYWYGESPPLSSSHSRVCVDQNIKALKISTRMPGHITIKASSGLAVFLWLARAVRRVLNDKVCRYCMMSASTLQFPPCCTQMNMDWRRSRDEWKDRSWMEEGRTCSFYLTLSAVATTR